MKCGSYLPWILAIEALGCSNLVEPSLLKDILLKTPQTSNRIGNARELMSLKYLESLFVQGARANRVSSTSSIKVRFDPSDNCEDVLRQILSEVLLIFSFSSHFMTHVNIVGQLNHLQSSSADNLRSYQQTSISEQKPSGLELSKWDLESFIKHKKSNLRKCTLEQLKDGIVTGSLSISASLKEKSGLLVGIHVENQAPAKDGNCSTSIAEGGDKDDGNFMASEPPDENLAPVNRKRKADESPAEKLYTTCIDPAKKNKYDIICNEQDAGLENGGKGLCGPNEDIDKDEQNVPNTVETVDEAEDGADISSNDDGSHDESKIIHKKKETFLSSQCTYSQDELGTTCMKCKKGGNLLSCTSDSCPIVIHESCLGSDKSFDTREKFYCPFCAYSRALSKCEEVKKYVSLIRKDLATFICLGGPNSELKKQSCRSSMMDGNCLKQNDVLPKTNELNQINVVEKVSNHQHRKKLECEQAGQPSFRKKSCRFTKFRKR